MIKKQNKINNVLLSIVVIFLIGVLTFSTIKVIKYIVDNKENEKIEEEISYLVETTNNEEQEENNNKYNIEFATLKEKNSDTVGYLKVNGTDRNIIIYGHNMRNNTMFGTLKNVLNEEWKDVEENRFITFITEKDSYIYEVFSVYQIEAEDYYITTNFKNDEEFLKFANTLKSRSKYNFDVDIKEEDSILTLSTCANNNKYRVIVHSVRVK